MTGDLLVIGAIAVFHSALSVLLVLTLERKEERRQSLREQSEAIAEETPTRLWHV